MRRDFAVEAMLTGKALPFAIAVVGNFIGNDKNGSFDLGNVIAGVSVSGSDNVVGGSRSGQANVIANSVGDGVQVTGDDSVRNRILRNSIHDNGLPGIDLRFDNDPNGSVTANDDKDSDTGANNLQNKPTLTSAVTGGNPITIKGSLNSNPIRPSPSGSSPPPPTATRALSLSAKRASAPTRTLTTRSLSPPPRQCRMARA